MPSRRGHLGSARSPERHVGGSVASIESLGPAKSIESTDSTHGAGSIGRKAAARARCPRRGPWTLIALVAATSAAASASCSYPDFGFGPDETKSAATGSGEGASAAGGAGTGAGASSSASGDGGAGAGATGGGPASSSTGHPASSSTTSSASSSASAGGVGGDASGGAGGSPVVPQVDCTEAQIACAPGDVCCFHELYPGCDYCSTSPDCNSEACDGNYFALSCNSSADCPKGTQCCGVIHYDAVFYDIIFSAKCSPTCSADEPELCLVSADCDPGMTCKALDYPGWGYCD